MPGFCSNKPGLLAALEEGCRNYDTTGTSVTGEGEIRKNGCGGGDGSGNGGKASLLPSEVLPQSTRYSARASTLPRSTRFCVIWDCISSSSSSSEHDSHLEKLVKFLLIIDSKKTVLLVHYAHSRFESFVRTKGRFQFGLKGLSVDLLMAF